MHIGLSYKNHGSKVIEKIAPFEKFLQSRKEEARMG